MSESRNGHYSQTPAVVDLGVHFLVPERATAYICTAQDRVYFGRILRRRPRGMTSEFATSSEGKNSSTIQTGSLLCSKDMLLE
jgi:hypothetical protein